MFINYSIFYKLGEMIHTIFCLMKPQSSEMSMRGEISQTIYAKYHVYYPAPTSKAMNVVNNYINT